MFDLACQAVLPQVRLVVRADAATEGQCRVGVQGEGQYPQHHAQVCFRGVPCERQGEVAVNLAVQVGNIEMQFVDS